LFADVGFPHGTRTRAASADLVAPTLIMMLSDACIVAKAINRFLRLEPLR